MDVEVDGYIEECGRSGGFRHLGKIRVALSEVKSITAFNWTDLYKVRAVNIFWTDKWGAGQISSRIEEEKIDNAYRNKLLC